MTQMTQPWVVQVVVQVVQNSQMVVTEMMRAAVTGSEGPDERAARSELAHMFSDALEPEGSNVEELDGSNAEAAPKISAQMNVPQAGRLYKRAVVSQ